MTVAIKHTRCLVAIVAMATLPLQGVLGAQAPNAFDQTLLKGVPFRNLGPFRMGARIADIAVPDSPARAHQYTIYVAPWTGGIFKTTNNGTTWEPIFDNVSARLTVGAIAIAHSNPGVVWVGTGDAFTSRSSYAGDGMYKSTDAGKTWTHLGLEDTQHIARIVVDPNNADVALVAAMGHLYSDNQARGVYKTSDGGKTWSKVLYVNDKVGVIDLVMNPANPRVLYAATYDKVRLPWQLVSGGPESAVYKTVDGGAHWSRLHTGLPSGRIGRIGLALYPKNPDIIYALIENANPRPPTRQDSAAAQRTGQPVREREIGGEVYRTADGGATWKKMSADSVDVSSKGPYYFSQIFVDPNNDQHIFTTGVSLGNSIDGGRTWHDISWPPQRLFPASFGDVRTFWIDPQDSDRMILGSDGGIFQSYDGGKTSDHYANLPMGEAYTVAVDNDEPYNIYTGLQDHENWKGSSNGPHGYTTTWDWTALGNGDGIVTVPDPTDSRWVYTTLNYGGHERLDQREGMRQNIQPTREAGKPPYRFIWDTPVIISPHDSKTIYTGAQVLLRSTDRGDHWEEISPDLSTNPADKIMPNSEGGIPGGIPWFGISSIAESPVTAGLLWVGTSDGNVQMTRDAGSHWTDVTDKVAAAGGRADAYVSRVAASAHNEGTAYVAKSGYKLDDFHAYLYKTTDHGATWTSISSNLPVEPVNVIREDPDNASLLFAGTDAGLFVTMDGGARWVRMTNIPNMPVRDLAMQQATRDLVVGSYGRGIFIANIAPLEEMSASTLAEDVHLFRVLPTVPRIEWQFGANDYLFGNRHLQTDNAPDGMSIRYYLRAAAADSAVITVADAKGEQVVTLKGPAKAGVNTVTWNTHRATRGGRGRGAGAGADSSANRGGGGGRGRGNPLDALVPAGEYTVTLRVDGKTLTQSARITGPQGWSIGPFPSRPER